MSKGLGNYHKDHPQRKEILLLSHLNSGQLHFWQNPVYEAVRQCSKLLSQDQVFHPKNEKKHQVTDHNHTYQTILKDNLKISSITLKNFITVRVTILNDSILNINSVNTE